MLPVQVMDIVLDMRSRDFERRAERSRRAHPVAAWERAPESLAVPVRIRRAQPQDADALTALAELDGHRRPLAGTVLLAELGGAIVAARSLEDATAIADPFAPSAGPAALLRLRAEQVKAAAHVRGGRRLVPRLHRRAA